MLSLPFRVEKSVQIHKPPSEVFEIVSDFGTWGRWSPWLCQEPACPVNREGKPGSVGHSQAWSGDFIGSGQMTISAVKGHERLDYDLAFLKPWKSKSKVGFLLTPEGDGTRLTWTMEGTLPFFLFFMKKVMSALVGGDYLRGLAMLKELIESGDVPTMTSIEGATPRDSFHYVGKRRSCSISEVGPAMEEDLGLLHRMLSEGVLVDPEKVFSIYHKYDFVKGTCEYTTGFLYGDAHVAPEGLVAGNVPAHRAIHVNHRGPYRHLGNAWSAAMGYVRAKHKANKALPMYEVYGNCPHDVDEKELLVDIFVPVK